MLHTTSTRVCRVARVCLASNNFSTVLPRCVGLPRFTTGSAVVQLGKDLDVHNIEGIVGRDVLLVDAGIEGQAATGAGGCRDNGFGRAS